MLHRPQGIRTDLPAAIAEIGCPRNQQQSPLSTLDKTHNIRIRDRPLCRPPNTLIQTILICIVPAIGIRQEERIDIPSFKQLRKIDPVVQPSLLRRPILRVLFAISVVERSEISVLQQTFHCPGDRCPTVHISKALRRIFFLPGLSRGTLWA
jgi:hypothetical protein